MVDGREYTSPVDLTYAGNLRDEIRRAIQEIEVIRGRPLLLYASNVVNPPKSGRIDINLQDDLPFSEMVDSVPAEVDSIDMFLVTPGGSAQQVYQFVNRMRPRFENGSFFLPPMTMSAGTIWVLSGNEIWMGERAFIGPIDPQVSAKDGRLIPYQALLVMLRTIEAEGEERIKNGQKPNWAHVELIKHIDAKEIGDAISQTQYAAELAAHYLNVHKFKDWTHHSDGKAVTEEEKFERAEEIADTLCSHDMWKTHSHGIPRDVAWDLLRIKINHPESVDGLARAMRRLWAFLQWSFERTHIAKIFMSQQYSLFRTASQE